METFVHSVCQRLRETALALPETSEGASCVNRAFKVRKKNFLFVGEKDDQVRIMVKLTDSLAAAGAMDDPRVEVGVHGWVTIRFAADDALDSGQLVAWANESFRALAPKTVLAQIEQP
jgi:hypothetical protein